MARDWGITLSLETATYVDSLVVSNPDGTDQRSTADDHLRLIKACIKRTFPLIAGAVSASHQAISYVNDLTSSVQAQINMIASGSLTAGLALNANSASFALFAGQASSASYATFANSASSAAVASQAGHAQSASFATFAGLAQSASFAAVAGDSAMLGSVFAANYARLDVNQAWTAGQAITQTSSSGATLTPNALVSCMFRHAMTASSALTIAAPIGPRSGQVISIHLVNGGSSTASWNAIYKFAGGVAPTLSTTASAVDVFAFQYDVVDAVWRQAGIGVA